jgi:hypothetical protein
VRFTRFVAAQEQPYEWNGSLTNTSGVIHVYPSTTGSLAFRFTRLDQYPLGVPFYPFYLNNLGPWNFNSLLLRDCELFQGKIYLWGPGPGGTPSFTLVNNLFDNV